MDICCILVNTLFEIVDFGVEGEELEELKKKAMEVCKKKVKECGSSFDLRPNIVTPS